jgi:tetratricopeptide (TPR) repeat protein
LLQSCFWTKEPFSIREPLRIVLAASDLSSAGLKDLRVAFLGKLASMSRRSAAQLVRSCGAVVAERIDPSVQLVIVGEDGLPITADDREELFDEPVRQAIERKSMEVITETQLWQRLGLVEAEQDIHRLYTPAMLADLLGLPIQIIRRWHRRGLIVPVREVRRLAYFDFQEVATARRLAELLAAGVSPAAIEKKLADLARYLPQVERPLVQLSVIIEGKDILLRQGDGLVEPGGQLRFDFDAAAAEPRPGEETSSEGPAETVLLSAGQLPSGEQSLSPEQMTRLAAELEEEGQLELAAEMYRAAMAAAGPSAEVCFQVAEILYRLGDLGGARERYYMAVELDEDYVEARANLGCVLVEMDQDELAVAAFRGALAFHADYADVHFHLARLLDDLGRTEESPPHWRAFLELAPDSPWAEQARSRLGAKAGGIRE